MIHMDICIVGAVCIRVYSVEKMIMKEYTLCHVKKCGGNCDENQNSQSDE